jgi:hypothetical protein
MNTDDRANTPTRRKSQWRWPQEAHVRGEHAAPAARAKLRPHGFPGSEDLRRAVLDAPDDHAPRHAYAAWMAAREHPLARQLGAFVSAQLAVAEAFRDDPKASVSLLRSWSGDPAFVSMIDFRAGGALRPWLLDDLEPLISRGLVGWPQLYRGFVERVGMRAAGFLECAPELFALAPIRYLVLIGVPQVVDALAASPHLRRIRSLSLPRYSGEDELTEQTVRTLLASPHLANLVHLRLVHQHRVTPRAYEEIATAPTLPLLSSFEVYELPHRWEHAEPPMFDPKGRAERMIAFDTPMAVMRRTAWIAAMESSFGYEPCLHPETYYGREFVDIEPIAAHPIALDPRIMARRGLSATGQPLREASR